MGMARLLLVMLDSSSSAAAVPVKAPPTLTPDMPVQPGSRQLHTSLMAGFGAQVKRTFVQSAAAPALVPPAFGGQPVNREPTLMRPSQEVEVPSVQGLQGLSADPRDAGTHE